MAKKIIYILVSGSVLSEIAERYMSSPAFFLITFTKLCCDAKNNLFFSLLLKFENCYFNNHKKHFIETLMVKCIHIQFTTFILIYHFQVDVHVRVIVSSTRGIKIAYLELSTHT